jgi:hypothetical protein
MEKIDEITIIAIINDAIGQYAEGEPVKLTISSSMDNTPEWDSLTHLSILSALDSAYNGRVAAIPEIGSAYSVERIIDLLKTLNRES